MKANPLLSIETDWGIITYRIVYQNDNVCLINIDPPEKRLALLQGERGGIRLFGDVGEYTLRIKGYLRLFSAQQGKWNVSAVLTKKDYQP